MIAFGLVSNLHNWETKKLNVKISVIIVCKYGSRFIRAEKSCRVFSFGQDTSDCTQAQAI